MSKLIMSAFADEHSDSLVEQCRALNNYGIDYIELRGVDGKNVSTLTADEVKQVKSVLCAHELKASAIGSPIGKVKLDAELGTELDAHFEMAKRVFETAAELEARYVRMFSFYLPDGSSRADCREAVIDALGRLLELADGFGLRLCHENEALIYGESPEDCLELLRCFGGRLGCVFDMGNFALEGYDPMRAYELLCDYIDYFHIKDALGAGAIVPPGKGEARIGEILEKYRNSGKKDTFITLEPHLQTFSGLNALAGVKFDNPYKYENSQAAFDDAVDKLRGLL